MLAEGTHHVLLRHATAPCLTSVAVRVQRSAGPGSGWKVHLHPGLRLVNRLGTAVCCHVSSGLAQAQAETLELGGGGGASPLQLLEALPEEGGGAPPPPGQLHLWLGAAHGWSQALPLCLQGGAPAVQVLCSERRKGWAAVGASAAAAGGLPPPVGAERQRLAPLGAVLAQVLPPEPATGQATVVLWPPARLCNRLPFAVHLELPPALDPDAGDGEPPGRCRRHELAPGEDLALAVAPSGGEVVRVAAGPAAPTSLPIVVPSLASLGDDEAALDSAAALSTAAAAGAGDALFLPPPGQAVQLHLPGAPAGFASSGSVAVWLVTEQASALPQLALTLLPLGVVRSCLPMPVQLCLPDCTPVDVLPGSTALLDWQGRAEQPAEALVQLSAPAQPPGPDGCYSAAAAAAGQHVVLRSQPFRLEAGADAHLVLANQQRTMSVGTSGGGLFGRRGGAGPQAADVLARSRLECRLAARVEVVEHAGKVIVYRGSRQHC